MTENKATITPAVSTTTKILEARSLFDNKKYKEAGEALNKIK